MERAQCGPAFGMCVNQAQDLGPDGNRRYDLDVTDVKFYPLQLDCDVADDGVLLNLSRTVYGSGVYECPRE